MLKTSPSSIPSYYTAKRKVLIKKIWVKGEGIPNSDASMIVGAIKNAIASPSDIEGEIEEACLSPLEFTINSDVFKREMPTKVVVLKIRRRTLDDNSADDMFFRELKAWMPLKHRNILSLLEVQACFPGLHVALVSEYKRNGTLLHYVRVHPEADRIRLLIDVAEGLRYLHSQESPIIHGDIRGANVAVGDNGEAMIFDFGCAYTEEEAKETVEYDGTLRWMAPEKIDPNRTLAVTPKADIYSFGCLCIEVFTGEKPFVHIVPEYTVMFKVVQDKEPPIRARPTGQSARQLNDSLWETMQSCWAFEPSRRPFSSDICRTLISMTIGSSQSV